MTSRPGLAYAPDINGNLLSDGVVTYTCDHANRLTQVVSGTLTTQYAYNGDGACPERKRRICKTVDSATTQYLVDLVATLPVVISDTEAIYLYGLDIIAQQQGAKHMFLSGHFIWPCLLPIVALLVALAVLGVRDTLFAIDFRSWRKAARGLALLAAPIVVTLFCILVLGGAVLKLMSGWP